MSKISYELLNDTRVFGEAFGFLNSWSLWIVLFEHLHTISLIWKCISNKCILYYTFKIYIINIITIVIIKNIINIII